MTPVGEAGGPAPPVLACVCGLAMAALAGLSASGMAAATVLPVAGAVVLGLRWRAAATGAVLLAVAAIAITDAPSVWAAATGLSAVGYLMLRHRAPMTPATVTFALGFTVAGLVATVFPWRLPWLPLLAPFVLFGLYALAAQPFLLAGPDPVRRPTPR
ncbi:hypothetical protein AWC02_13215 [Mycolicibacter engbaekii]|uniref:Integral membrane protein n=1 Tax=Mycolicibacter engbaekii TaxID=188915 RepID=A0A1X1TLV8_9MYCO|nr:hypothetical protein [Mycolicibacter engbaekii]ORV45523.1 hypothetical protein AWC02_13215 [Mycolicibacter engbaekii]